MGVAKGLYLVYFRTMNYYDMILYIKRHVKYYNLCLKCLNRNYIYIWIMNK